MAVFGEGLFLKAQHELASGFAKKGQSLLLLHLLSFAWNVGDIWVPVNTSNSPLFADCYADEKETENEVIREVCLSYKHLG